MPPEDDKTKTDAGAAAVTDDKPAVTFKTREEFHREVDRKTKAAVATALDAFKGEMFGQLGIESDDDLPKLKESIAASAKTATETEKLKSALDKATKEHGKTAQRAEALQAKLKGIARRDALAPFAGKVRDMEALSMFADRHLEVDDDGGVTVKDGGKVEDWVETLLKAKDYLRVPAATQGAGTTATEPRKPNDGTQAATGGAATTTTTVAASAGANGQAANGTAKPKTFGAVVAEAIMARHTFPVSGP